MAVFVNSLCLLHTHADTTQRWPVVACNGIHPVAIRCNRAEARLGLLAAQPGTSVGGLLESVPASTLAHTYSPFREQIGIGPIGGYHPRIWQPS